MRSAFANAGWPALVLLLVVGMAACGPATAQLSDAPDTPFKLATFDADGSMRIGLVLGDQLLDLAGASDHLVAEAGVESMALPAEMRALIEPIEAHPATET